jgi:hypothetical protein
MAIDYSARPTDAKNFTTSSEVNLTQDFQDYSEFLPAINRTESLQNFFGATVNQLLSSGSTQSIDAYWGRLAGRNYNPENELFQPESTATRLNYQFQPGVVSRLAGKPQQTTSYINWLNRLESLGADVNNHDRLFSEQGYVLDLPINADMFTNYHNYYWLEGDIPLVEIDLSDYISFDIDTITAKSQHTTGILANNKTVKFVTGLRVKFVGANVISTSGDYPVDSIYYVENVGGKGGIKLIEIENATGIDLFPKTTPYRINPTENWDLSLHDPNTPSDNYSLNTTYSVMERWASDKNPWARTNHWFSIHAIQIAAEYNNVLLEVYANKFTRASRPIIEFNANMELDQTCKNYIEVVDYTVTAEQVTVMLSGVSEYYVTADSALENGDIVLVATPSTDNVGSFNPSFSGAYSLGEQSAYYPDAFTVGGVGSDITLTPYNTYTIDDCVIVGKGSETGYVYCFKADGWNVAQNKTTRGTAPLFVLYDEHNVSLNDFSNTDFAGDKIFSYATALTGVYDRELGIKPEFTNSGSFGNFNFDWSLNNNRYNENVTVVSREEIRGLYYFHNWVDNAYYNGWSNIVGGQRVPIIQTQVSDGANNIVFELGTAAISRPTEYTVSMVEDQLRWYTNSYIDRVAIGYDNPELILKYDTDYTINDLICDDASKLEMVDPYGNADANIIYGGTDTIKTFSVDMAYEYDTVVYRRVDDPTVAGEILLTDTNHNTYEVIRNGQRLIDGTDYTFSGTQITLSDVLVENDVVELSYVANTDMANAVYDVAPVHFYNSENKPFVKAGYEAINKHLRSQLNALPGFTGNVNGLNNYHQTLRQHTHGGVIRQQIFETKKVQYLLDQEDINPIRALKSFSSDYADFKQFFKNKVRQLWTTQSWDTVQALVNQALSDINIGKNATFKYANSDMLYYTQAQTATYPMILDVPNVFALPRTRNQYGDTQNHVNVWLTDFDAALNRSVERPLTVGIDYTINGQEVTLLANVNLPASLTIKWYDNTQNSNVPFSAVKLGFIKPTQVEVVGGELIGHDGARHTLTGSNLLDMDSAEFDVVSAALRDFELRIFNNLVDTHFVNATIGQSMATLYPTPSHDVGYTVADINVRLDDWYNRWAVRNAITDIDLVNYDAGNEFTWNYSTVGPNLGSWRSLYVYTFGTDRPDTHPWEMLGHNVKPTWWDTHYSWTAGTKRNSLEQAVQYGITGSKDGPTQIDLRYARPTFDKSTYDLVSDDGTDTLFGPVTAGVIVAPSALDAAKDFVFGDWSEIENNWRKSSEYPFALAEVYLQLKPYRTHETFWKLGRWTVNTNVTQEQWIDTQTCNRTHISEIHNELIDDGIIDHITVINGGTGYGSLDLEFKADKMCYRNATAVVYTDANLVTSVAVTNPGRGFENAPTVVYTGSGSGVELEFIIDFNVTATRLGFNTLPAEEYTVTSENTNVLSTTLANLEVNYMLHMGGYTDKRILQVEVDGDYNSGLINIPDNSYDILIDRNAPTNTLFYSGVKIEKVAGSGYRVSGYDLDSKFFNFLRPSNSGKQVGITIGNAEIIKHFNWHNEISRVSYNTVIYKRQELYQFLLGMGKYYETLGFDVYTQWETEAYSAITWSLNSDSTDPYYVNGIDNTLTYNQGTHGVVQTVDINYDGVPNVLDANFKNIRRAELLVLRNNDSTEYSLKSATDRIYGLGVRVVEFEHIIVLNNITTFNDPIYQPELGVGLNRVHLVGERTRNWNGRVEAPGYLVRDSGLVLNLESSVHELETELVTSESKALERLTRQTIGYNVGYTKPTYMTDMFITDNSAYRFEKGVREYKGTAVAIQAMTRNKNIFGSSFEHEIYEEWMVRLGDFGDVSERNPVQFAVKPIKIKSDPQHFRLNNEFTSDKSEDLIIDLHKGSADSISGNYESPFATYDVLRLDNTSIEDLEQYQPFLRDAGLPLVDEINYYLGSVDDIGTIYDPTEEYALIPNWSDTAAYVKGDRIRRYGNVYRLTKDITGLTAVQADVILRGTQQYPVVANGQTFIANGTTVLFVKQSTNVSNDPIILNGSAIAPVVPSGSTMPLNGVSVNFIKTTQNTTYGAIVLDGNVTSPSIINGAGKVFTVYYANSSGASLDAVNVPFDELKTTMIMQKIWRDALLTSGATNTANARIAALEVLRNAYITGAGNTASAWETFIGNYYATTPDLYVNPEYLGIQVAANLGAAWEIDARTMIQLDLDLLTELGGTHIETETTMVSGRGSFNDSVTFDADMSTTNTLLDFTNTATDVNENLQAFRDYVISNGGIAITTGLEITVPNPTDYVTDYLSAIETKISTALVSAAAPATITVTTVGDVITLSRTGNVTGYRLGASTFGELGFLSADNDVETPSTTTTDPTDLTLAEAVLAVNNAAIDGIAAQLANNRMRITCNSAQLEIGAGSGTNALGFNVGLINAVTNTTTVPVDLAIGDLVTQINTAAITNLTATQVEGALILTYTGSSLIIGEGTANTEIGIIAKYGNVAEDSEYNNGAISDLTGNGSNFFKREVTVNGVRIVAAGAVGGQTAVPDAFIEKVARMFELFTDANGPGINETTQRNLIKNLSGDTGTDHAGLPTLQRVARGAGGEYTPNFLTDDGIESWNLSPLFDTHVANDMVWYLNSTGDGYGDGEIDAQEVIEHVFHTLHMHGLPSLTLKMYPDFSADWQTGELFAAIEEAYDSGVFDPSGYVSASWKTDSELFPVIAKEYLYLLNFSMFEYTGLWDGDSLAPEWSDSMRTQAGILSNNPLGYALFNTYIAPVISKPSLATINSIFGDGNTPAQDDPALAGASGYVVDLLIADESQNAYVAYTSENQNTFLVTDWEIVQDPAHFNIWTIDNIGSNPIGLNTTTNRYDVLQTLDFRIGVLEICAGDETGDDALIKCDTITTLAVGEYVLIINSTCIPSIDGIHQVTRLSGAAGFFIDRYIEQKGLTGKVLPLRSVRFSNTTVASAAMADTTYVQDGLGLRSGDYVYVDERLDTNDISLGYGAVYTVQRSVVGAALNHLRDESGKTENSQIKNGTLYSDTTGETVINFEVYDPLKGIIPGVAGREINIRSDYDFAYYNNSTDPDLELRVKNTWGAAQVGKVWWDLSNAIYLNYDQSTPEYRQTHWGELFPTATIDVYEWTKSPVTPDVYQDAVNAGTIIDGNELTGVAYSIVDQFDEAQYNWCEEAELNINTNQIDIYFYFWVSRKTTTPSIAREYSILQLAATIADPTTQQVDWIAATSANTVLVSSLTRSVVYDDLIMQINFDKGVADYHQEFAVLAENDPALVIPEWLHISLRDSLAGFTQATETVTYTQWDSVKSYTPDAVVLSTAGDYFRNHIASTNNDPDADTANDYWTLLEFNENNPDGIYTGNDTVSLNIPQRIPDLNLHPSVRYGIETRPSQTWFININNARKALVEKINSQFIGINIVDSYIPWRTHFERTFTVNGYEYDITQYWNFHDWSIEGYIFDSTVGDYFVETVSELATLTPTLDQIAQVERSTDPDGRTRRSVWRYSGGIWSLVYKEKATIQFNSLLWNHTMGQSGWDTVAWDTTGWDISASAVMVEIFNSFYTSIWTQEYRGLYADIWFHMAKHVLGEQNEVDWIFKTSYFKLIVEDTLEKQYNKYFTEHTDDFFDFVDTIKPFHSKLRDGIVRKLADEAYDAVVLDTAEIRVQTNPSGSTIDETLTRSFRLTVGNDNSNYSSQIVNEHKVLLGTDISDTALIIPYLRSTTESLSSGPGVIWINGERITYTTISNVGQSVGAAFSAAFSAAYSGVTLLSGVERGTNGTLARAHAFGDIIEDATNLSLVEKVNLSDYGPVSTNYTELFPSAWNIRSRGLLDVANDEPNAITIRAESFGTIDLIGDIQFSQFLALQESNDAIVSFQSELEELIELMSVEFT